MKFRKDEMISNDYGSYYQVSDTKDILILTEMSREIVSIGLIDAGNAKTEWFKPKGLWYLENITEGDDCELLNIDSLMVLIAQEEHGYVRA